MNDTSRSTNECADGVMKQDGLLAIVDRVEPGRSEKVDFQPMSSTLVEAEDSPSVPKFGLRKIVDRVELAGSEKVDFQPMSSTLVEAKDSPSVPKFGLRKIVDRVELAGSEKVNFQPMKSTLAEMEDSPSVSRRMTAEPMERGRVGKTNLPAIDKNDVEVGNEKMAIAASYSGEEQSHENKVLNFPETSSIAAQLPQKHEVTKDAQAVVPILRAETQSGVKEKRPSAMKMADELAKNYTLGTFEGSVYIFEKNHYKLCDSLTLEKIIHSNIKWASFSAPGYNFLQDVRKFLILEALAKKFTAYDAERARKYIGFKNGYLELDTLQFFAPNPRVFITSYLNMNYTPLQFTSSTQALKQIHCPNFDRFVANLADDDPVLIERIYEMIGYILSNDCAAKKLFVAGGVKDSGKSRLGRFIMSLFNEGASCSISIGRLGERFALGKLPGKALCVDLDLPSTKINSRTAAIIKSLTGSDLITAENKYEHPMSFTNRTKLLYATNHTIEISEAEYVLCDRIVYIPVRRTVPQNQQIPNLLDHFEAEKLLIVMKAIGFYRQLVENKYKFSGNFPLNSAFMDNSSGAKMPMEDMISKFVAERILFAPWSQWEFTDDLYKAFCDYYGVQQDEHEYRNFSRIFFRVCGTKVDKDKKRRDNAPSPLSVFLGAKLKEATEKMK